MARCRRIFAQRRVGHAGTLDPDATGVLLVGLGRATRLMRFLTALPKSYSGEIVLGRETTTLDASGSTVADHDMSGVTLEAVQDAATHFVGPIEQVPPMVSAVKVGGQRLYKLARAANEPGAALVEVDRPRRPVVVHRLEVTPTPDPGVFAMDVECSSGTYVRSLAADIGTALGGGAHLRNLRRTGIGSFKATDATPLDALGPGSVLTPAETLRDYPRALLEAKGVAAVSHGRPLSPGDIATNQAVPGADGAGPGPVAVLDAGGTLLGVYERQPDGWWRAAVVMAAQ